MRRILFPCLSAALFMGLIQGKLGIKDYFQLRESRTVLEAAIDKIEYDIDDLETEIEKLKTSKTYAKRILKEKFHEVEENEKIVIFTD